MWGKRKEKIYFFVGLETQLWKEIKKGNDISGTRAENLWMNDDDYLQISNAFKHKCFKFEVRVAQLAAASLCVGNATGIT